MAAMKKKRLNRFPLPDCHQFPIWLQVVYNSTDPLPFYRKVQEDNGNSSLQERETDDKEEKEW